VPELSSSAAVASTTTRHWSSDAASTSMVLTQTLLGIENSSSSSSSSTADCVHLHHVHPHHPLPHHHNHIHNIHPAAAAAVPNGGQQSTPAGAIVTQLIVDDLTSTSVVPLQPDSAALPPLKSHSLQQLQQLYQHQRLQQHHVAMPNMAPTATAVTQQSATFRDAANAPLRKLSVDLIKTYKHINEVSITPRHAYRYFGDKSKCTNFYLKI